MGNASSASLEEEQIVRLRSNLAYAKHNNDYKMVVTLLSAISNDIYVKVISSKLIKFMKKNYEKIILMPSVGTNITNDNRFSQFLITNVDNVLNKNIKCENIINVFAKKLDECDSELFLQISKCPIVFADETIKVKNGVKLINIMTEIFAMYNCDNVVKQNNNLLNLLILVMDSPIFTIGHFVLITSMTRKMIYAGKNNEMCNKEFVRKIVRHQYIKHINDSDFFVKFCDYDSFMKYGYDV
jgi:hypothetical protein